MIFCTNTLLCFVRVYHNQQAAFWAALAFTRDLARTLTSERASLPRAVMEIAHQTGRRADSLRTAIAKKKYTPLNGLVNREQNRDVWNWSLSSSQNWESALQFNAFIKNGFLH
jgi:hypothetical protein